jgi:hypothetical protein
VSVRRLAALLPLVAALMLGSGLVAPAQAAATDPVTGLTVNQVQTPGHNDRWSVTATWDANGATSYTVQIVPNADGSGTPYAGPQDTANTSVTLTTAGLLAGQTYYVAVYPTAAGASAVATKDFVALSLDTTAPTGTFTVAPTHSWLTFDFLSLEESQTASVTITQTSAVEAGVTRKVVAGDGSTARPWTSGSSLVITYKKAGTFTPKVELTDPFGNASTVALNTVTIAEDTTAPVVRIARPAASMRDRIAGWRKIHGTAVDGQTGVDTVLVMLVQKRGAYWYVYNFHKHVWLKGRTGQIATLAHTKARPAILSTDSLDQWHTGRIRGLKTGKIVVRAAAFDNSINLGMAIVRQRITRS